MTAAEQQDRTAARLADFYAERGEHDKANVWAERANARAKENWQAHHKGER